MNRKGMWLVAALACALAAPIQTLSATSGVAVGSTTTALDLCPGGPGGVTYPAVAPSGCQGGSTGATTVTFCAGTNVHAYVRTQIMVDGKRPTLEPLAGTVVVHVESPVYGTQNNVATSPEGIALAELGSLAPGTYDVEASLWTGMRTLADGTTASYPGSRSSMTMVIPDGPCTPTTDPGKTKKGCGNGDANHYHDPKTGKACPTK